jgi:hypothetical protein
MSSLPNDLQDWLRARGVPACATWLDFDRTTGAITRWRDEQPPEHREGRWHAAIECDRDCIAWLGDDGAVYHDVDGPPMLVPVATTTAVYLARGDFWQQVRAALGDACRDPWVDFETTAPGLVAALGLERVDAASDAWCERFRGDGFAACVVHPSAFVERGKVRLYAGELPALIARVRELAARPELLGVGISVFGWPNQRTGDAVRSLAASLPHVRERNNYIGPLEPSDFVR